MTITMPAPTLREIRRRSDLSQAELARRSGIEQSTISRIEAGKVEPSWQTMQAVLNAAGWRITLERDPVASLIPPRVASRSVSAWLQQRDTWSALHDVVEAAGRIRALGVLPEGGLPGWAVAEPPSTGDPEWDTILATGLAYSIEQIGGAPEPWMTDAPPLRKPTLLAGDDPGEEFRDRIRVQTPARFYEKNILTRDRDWTIA